MTRLTKRSIHFLASLSDEEIRAQWELIGERPEHRVKKGGQIKLAWIKWSDVLLAELRRRRLESL